MFLFDILIWIRKE